MSQWDAESSRTEPYRSGVVYSESHGLISAYHTHHIEKQGVETQPNVYYFYRHEDKPFHIDYVFRAESLGRLQIS